MGETGFRIVDMKAEHFRHFLFMFYGLPNNQNYRYVMSNDNNTPQGQAINFHIYLDVAEISSRFSAPNLRSWAHAELRKIANSSYEELSRFSMHTDYQLRALLYAKRSRDEELATHVRNAIQLHFAWVSTSSPLKLVTTAGYRPSALWLCILRDTWSRPRSLDEGSPLITRGSRYAPVRTSSFDAPSALHSWSRLDGHFELSESKGDRDAN
ncbi:hypothetical protein B0J17DRAFT_100460 [Rhizoctonia solani]|nr:hypothetical protein B0J17DRAFT_100460 [Rhizoctonia solani]